VISVSSDVWCCCDGRLQDLPPEPVVDAVRHRAELTPIRLASCHGRRGAPLAEEITSDPDWMALLGRHGDAVLDLLAITTRRERAWINDPSLEDAVLLAAAVFEVNADFSWRTSFRRFRARPSDSHRRCAR
jgi:hypothetical protein